MLILFYPINHFNKEYIYNLFKKNNLNINKIVVENQKEIEDKLDVKLYLENQLKVLAF